MRLWDLTDTTADALKHTGSFVTRLMTPTLRLGVTGLARAGKTVFITALVRNLVSGGRLPFFSAMAEGRVARAYLEPQPDDQVPRFTYEEHLALLAGAPPRWPEGTRRISQLRVTIEYRPGTLLRRALGSGQLHVDIVDYPGEWLIDLPLLELSFAQWSSQALAEARASGRAGAAQALLEFVRALDANAAADEQVVLTGATLFTAHLKAAREPDAALSVPGPGRFLLPGDLAGSPLLTFFPLPAAAAPGNHRRGSLGAMLERRFESYKSHVVKPFFRDHFARLDRQIVLIDALAAINAGRKALLDLEHTMTSLLRCFRPGTNNWLSSILAPRVDRLLFAATKADHLHQASHDRLEAILRQISAKAAARASFAGAEVKVLALAALRATREAQARSGGQLLPCIVGVPLPGERLGRKVFDGQAEAVVFPGDLPVDATTLLQSPDARAGGADAGVHFLRFRPPRVALESPSGDTPPLPHIRLDRAMEFLLGDRLS